MANPLLAPVLGFLSKLSFPRLFLLAAGLFVLDALTLDPLPFVDEILLGLGTLLLAKLRTRKDADVIESPVEPRR
jgi:hypothetical protein